MQNGIYEFSVRDHCGNVLPYPVDVANIDLMPPTADYELLTDEWTNVPVTIRVKADDLSPEDGYAPSGIRSITLPDGEVVEADTADFIAEQNGSYDFIVTDNAGNTYTLHTEVSNIDYLSPQAQCTIDPGQWTNQPVAMHITATDPSPEDGYAPSGIQSITLPDGMVVDDSQAVFTADKNGKYDFVITDRGGNTFVLHTEVKIIDDLLPTAKYSVVPGKWTNESQQKIPHRRTDMSPAGSRKSPFRMEQSSKEHMQNLRYMKTGIMISPCPITGGTFLRCTRRSKMWIQYARL